MEKVINLDDVSLVDFLGVENRNINEISMAFPDSRITSRGDVIRIEGSIEKIERIQQILQDLLAHLEKHGSLPPDLVGDYIRQSKPSPPADFTRGLLLHGLNGRKIVALTPGEEKLLKLYHQHDIVFALGPAGTGKTFTSIALAISSLKKKEIHKIVVTRPVVEAGENLGFLPGDLREKIDPYLKPVFDAMDHMLLPDKVRQYIESGIIEIVPLAYMRGRDLRHSFIFLDEAQNTTPGQMKMFLTRMGLHSKMIITGDQTQIDLPIGQPSGLTEALKTLKGVEGIGYAYFEPHESVRHGLVSKILQAYQASERSRAPAVNQR